MPFANPFAYSRSTDGTYEYGATDHGGQTRLVSAIAAKSASVELAEER